MKALMAANPARISTSWCLAFLACQLSLGSLPPLFAESWDQINNSVEVHSDKVDFLLAKGSNQYVPSTNLNPASFAVATSDYTISCPPGLECAVVSVQADYANIVLGDYGDNAGIGITATISVHVPNDLKPGTRTVVMTFPGAVHLRILVGADEPTSPPVIEFSVTNFRSNQSRAAGRWWQWLLYGLLCIAAGLIALLVGGWGVIAGVISLVGAIYLFGRAVEDLRVIQSHPLLLISCMFALPVLVLIIFVREEDTLYMGIFAGICAAIVLSLLALVAWWRAWSRIEFGALALLPGFGAGTVLAALRRVRRKRC
jgi:hypothetical protein